MTRYVQHTSGQGRIFRVDDDNVFCWNIYVSDLVQHCWVPKSEYVLVPLTVPAPDRWVDVTEQCTVDEHDGLGDQQSIRDEGEKMVCWTEPKSCYRLRKVPICTGNGAGHEATKQWALIVERREP